MKKDLLVAVVIAAIASAAFVSTIEMQKPIHAAGDDQNILRMKGHLTMVLKDEQGKIKDYREFDNIVMKVGKDVVSNLVFNGNQSAPASINKANFIAIGTTANATSPGLNDRNSLMTECSGSTRQQNASPTTNRQGLSSGTTVTITGTFGAANCTGAVTESGLLDASSGGNMFARQVFSTINKGASDSLTVTWTITLS